MHTSLEHLFQLFDGISSTLEELFLSARVNLVPPLKSVHLQRLRTLHFELDHEPLPLSNFKECSNVEDIVINKIIPGASDIGQLKSVLVTGFVGLRYLNLRTGSAYSVFWAGADDAVQMRRDMAPSDEEMKSRNVEFRFEA